MSIETWRKTLNAAVDYGKRHAERMGPGYEQRVFIILHGGEPLTLPTGYLREVLGIFKEVTAGAPGRYDLAVQSNLYSVNEEKLALLLEHGASISFSYDVIPGARFSLTRRSSEAIVSGNIEMLRARGIPMGGIAVLAKHTVERITEVYDFYAQRDLCMRILPLFDGPPERPSDEFALDHTALVGALERLFRYWIETGCRVPITPFNHHLQSALRHMAGLRVQHWERRLHGDAVLLINVDGAVYRVADAYEPELALGNISRQTIDDILISAPYRASMDRDQREIEASCAGCSFRNACRGGYIHDARMSMPHEGPCPIAYHCIDFIQRYVREQGYGDADIRELLGLIVKRGNAKRVADSMGI